MTRGDFNDYEDDAAPGARRWLPWAGAALLAAGFVALCAWVVSTLESTPPPTPPKVQQISIVQPPPPPPPPQIEEPPEEKIEEIAEPEPAPEPEPVAEEPPPGAELGVDAEGVAGSDGFGLRAKKGGRGLIGGGGGNAIVWYGQKLGGELSAALRDALADTIADAQFSVLTAVWVDADGRVSRAELAGSSGDEQLDATLRQALASLHLRMPQAPPTDMPQPVRIRVNARS